MPFEGLRGFLLGLIEPDHHGDIAGHPLGQATGHGFPMFLEEGPGHGHLHQGHRQDDDQQGPGKQALGQETAQHSHCP